MTSALLQRRGTQVQRQRDLVVRNPESFPLRVAMPALRHFDEEQQRLVLLWNRLLGRSASECGSLCRDDEGQGRGDRGRMALVSTSPPRAQSGVVPTSLISY
jgi:hypothetical protein